MYCCCTHGARSARGSHQIYDAGMTLLLDTCRLVCVGTRPNTRQCTACQKNVQCSNIKQTHTHTGVNLMATPPSLLPIKWSPSPNTHVFSHKAGRHPASKHVGPSWGSTCSRGVASTAGGCGWGVVGHTANKRLACGPQRAYINGGGWEGVWLHQKQAHTGHS